MKRNSISIPDSGKYPEAINQLKPAIRLNSHDARSNSFSDNFICSIMTAQSALAQYKKITLVHIELSIRLNGEIYADKVIQVGRK